MIKNKNKINTLIDDSPMELFQGDGNMMKQIIHMNIT